MNVVLLILQCLHCCQVLTAAVGPPASPPPAGQTLECSVIPDPPALWLSPCMVWMAQEMVLVAGDSTHSSDPLYRVFVVSQHMLLYCVSC